VTRNKGSANALLARWLRRQGIASEQIDASVKAIRHRTARYPSPIDRLYPTLLRVADLMPPALLFRPQRAQNLDDANLDALETALHTHPHPWVRLLSSLARMPGYDIVYPDHAPDAPEHPLDALEPDIRRRRTHLRQDFDVMVIGSGAGGAPVAWSLARHGHRVAIVESGTIVRTHRANEALEHHYLDQAMVGSRTGMPLVLAGDAVGGTTAINSGTSFPPRDSCLRDWDLQLGTRLAEELPPWCDQAADHCGVTIPPRELLDASATLIERGLNAIGRQGTFVLPRNAPNCKGEGRCCFGCPTGAKQSTDRAYLPDAVEHGAVLMSETRALGIRETKSGVEVLVEGREGRRALRARAVVIAAGALSTPDILRTSRLGTRWTDAGNHLKIHPATKVFGWMPEPLRHGGVPQGLGYRAPELPRITFEGVHTPAAAAAPLLSLTGERHRDWMRHYDHVATFGHMCRDRTHGRVRRIAGRRMVEYALHPEDARDLGAGCLIIAEALFAAGATRVALPITGAPAELLGPDDMDRWHATDFTPERLMTSGFHPQGTAGIGRVVDEDLRVYGCANTWVCDASVLPDSPGVNPQMTIMGLGLRLAAHLHAELANRSTLSVEGSWAFESPRP